MKEVVGTLSNSLKKMLSAALFAAIICIATVVVVFPLPNGFANLGDCFVILAGVLLGYRFGSIGAAVGAALADLILGYAMYAPATLLIKGVMALCACLLFQKLTRLPVWVRALLAAVAAECIMLGGYFLYDTALYGVPAAVATLTGNGMQAAVGVVCATVLVPPLHARVRFFD